MAHVPVLYEETRLSPTPTSSSSILDVNTAGSNNGLSLFGAGRKRAHDQISGLDEESYARKHLASEASVFFRRRESTPRTFLWRVLEDRRLLQAQCVDLVSDSRSRKESWLTFHLTLPAPILKGGVALADPTDSDALELFVLTDSNELYTFILKRDLLTRETAPKEFDAATCYKKFVPSSFSFRRPYRLVAVSSLELLISLHDGGLMHLTRKAGDSGASWKESYFSEGGWSGTLKGLVPFRRQQTVRYGDLELETNAAAAIVKSPDGKYVWTVGLDHMLKAWNVETGKISFEKELLSGNSDGVGERRKAPSLMPAEQGALIKIVILPSSEDDMQLVTRTEKDFGRYCIVVHSPKDHQLGFYEISPNLGLADGESIKVNNIQPRTKFLLPIDELMNTNIWQLEDFYVKPGPEWQRTQIWIRARSGALCRTYELTIDLLDEDSGYIENVWQNGWTAVDPGSLTTDSLLHCLDCPSSTDVLTIESPSTPSERWLDFFFYPGRFSIASLETALSIYRVGRGLGGQGSRVTSEQPLKERLATAVASKIFLRRTPDELPDYDHYQQDIQAQWLIFFHLISHLHDRRHESINLAFDSENGLAWSVCADFVAPIRSCGTVERLCHNAPSSDWMENFGDDLYGRVFESDRRFFLSSLLSCARKFRAGLSAAWQDNFKAVAVTMALEGDDVVNVQPDRVVSLYQSTRLGDEVTEDDFNTLVAAAQQFEGLGELDKDDFALAIKLLEEFDFGKTVNRGMGLNKYGDRLMIAIAQETLQRHQSIVLDLLVLMVFMAGDLEPTELSPRFDAEKVYDDLMRSLKHHELLLWLAGHVRQEPQRSKRLGSGSLVESMSGSLAASQKEERPAECMTMTLLESIFIGDWSSHAESTTELPELLTQWAMAWTYGSDLVNRWAGITSHALANMIKHQDYDLATDFLKFVGDLPWQQYLKARLYIATGEYQLAEMAFNDAAEGLADKQISTYDTAHLLSPDELSSFGTGLSSYHQHVAQLFEKLRVFSRVVQFAYYALEQLDVESGPSKATLAELDKRKGAPNSPALQRIDDSITEIRILNHNKTKDDILNRIFNGCLRCGRFAEAFQAIARFTNPAFSRSNLKALIEGAVNQDAVPELLSLPLDGALARDADAILFSLAKSQLASGSTAGAPYHQILYAYRTQRGDFRGAAEILYERLERLRYSKKHHLMDPEDETLPDAFVLLINTMACCGEGEEWVLAEPVEGLRGVSVGKRKLVTVEDVRREYDAELNRRSEVLMGRFPMIGGGGDVRMEGDVL